MTAPPWGHKPLPVKDQHQFWDLVPSQPSPRMVYWMRRIRSGDWKPNKRILNECGNCQARLLGIWEWEANYAFGPLAEMVRHAAKPSEDILTRTAIEAVVRRKAQSMTHVMDYWRRLTMLSEPDAAS